MRLGLVLVKDSVAVALGRDQRRPGRWKLQFFQFFSDCGKGVSRLAQNHRIGSSIRRCIAVLPCEQVSGSSAVSRSNLNLSP